MLQGGVFRGTNSGLCLSFLSLLESFPQRMKHCLALRRYPNVPNDLMEGRPEEGSAATLGHFPCGRQPRDMPSTRSLRLQLSNAAVSAEEFPIGQMQMQMRPCVKVR